MKTFREILEDHIHMKEEESNLLYDLYMKGRVSYSEWVRAISAYREAIEILKCFDRCNERMVEDLHKEGGEPDDTTPEQKPL